MIGIDVVIVTSHSLRIFLPNAIPFFRAQAHNNLRERKSSVVVEKRLKKYKLQ